MVMQRKASKQCAEKRSIGYDRVSPRYPLPRDGDDYVSVFELGRHLQKDSMQFKERQEDELVHQSKVEARK